MVKTATKTLYPELVDSNIANSVEFVKKYSNFLPRIGSITYTNPNQPVDSVVPQALPGVNEDGTYQMDVRVTGYSPDEPTSDPDTRAGLASQTNTYGKLRQGYSVAVDPKVIPYGSRISIPGLGDNFVAMDTGGAVKSRQASKKTGGQPVIDVYFDSYSQQLQFERTNKPVLAAKIYPPDGTAIQSVAQTDKTEQQQTETVGDLTPQLETSINYWNAKKSGDPITALVSFFELLDSTTLKEFNNDFVFFWYKKLNSTIDVVKSQLNLADDSLLNAPSDSIGLLVNVKNKFDDSVSPITDVILSYGPPNIVPVSLKNKISSVTSSVVSEMSTKNSILMKGNLLNIVKTSDPTSIITDTTQSHGLNLMTDYNFYQTFYKNIESLINELFAEFSNTKDYITFFSNINDKIGYNCRNYTNNNLQQITDVTFDMYIEEANQTLDLLKNKIKDSMSNMTIKNTLSINQTLLSKPTLTTKDINDKFTYKQRSFNVIPISRASSALTNTRGAIQNLQIPNANLSRLNIVAQKTGITEIPSASQYLGDVNNLTSSITNLDAIKQVANLNMPLSLPSVDAGSFPELAAIATNTSFNNSDPQAILARAEAIKNTLCDFRLPVVGEIDFNALANADIDFDPESLAKRLEAILPKITLPKTDDFKKMFIKLKPTFNQIWKDFYAKYFECKNNNNNLA